MVAISFARWRRQWLRRRPESTTTFLFRTYETNTPFCHHPVGVGQRSRRRLVHEEGKHNRSNNSPHISTTGTRGACSSSLISRSRRGTRARSWFRKGGGHA